MPRSCGGSGRLAELFLEGCHVGAGHMALAQQNHRQSCNASVKVEAELPPRMVKPCLNAKFPKQAYVFRLCVKIVPLCVRLLEPVMGLIPAWRQLGAKRSRASGISG